LEAAAGLRRAGLPCKAALSGLPCKAASQPRHAPLSSSCPLRSTPRLRAASPEQPVRVRRLGWPWPAARRLGYRRNATSFCARPAAAAHGAAAPRALFRSATQRAAGPTPPCVFKGSKYGPGLASLDPGNNGEMVVIAKIHHSVLVPTHPPSPPPSTGLAKLGAGLLLQPALAGRRLPRRA